MLIDVNKLPPSLVRTILLAACASLLLCACGPRLVRGQSPLVNIQGVDTSSEPWVLRLRVRNVNDVAIQAAHVRYTIKLEDTELARYDASSTASVIASGAEIFRLDLDPSDAGRALIDSLESGEVTSLGYRIEGVIDTTEDGSLSFTGEGRIYPVPGRPGRYR